MWREHVIAVTVIYDSKQYVSHTCLYFNMYMCLYLGSYSSTVISDVVPKLFHTLSRSAGSRPQQLRLRKTTAS